MAKIINLILNKNNIFKHLLEFKVPQRLLLKLWFSLGLFLCYLGLIKEFYEPQFILYIIFGAIIVLGLIVHLLFARFNQATSINSRINNNSVNSINGWSKLTLKIFWLQFQIFILSNWLLHNLFVQANLNPKLSWIKLNLNLDHNNIITNGILIWVVFISILLSINIYKNYFNYKIPSIAKCLINNPNNSFKVFIYNLALNIELYLRISSIYALLIVIHVNLFEYLAKSFGLRSLIDSPVITSFLIVVFGGFFKKILKKTILTLTKKTNLNVVNIIILVSLLCGILIFLFVQLCLFQLDHLNLLTSASTNTLKILFESKINQYNVTILIIGINLILVFGLITNIIIKSLAGYRLSQIYLSSLIFPLFYIMIATKFNLHNYLSTIFNHQHATLLIYLITIVSFNLNYHKIYHLLCAFELKILKDHSTKSIKNNFGELIYRLMYFYLIYLNIYYIFGWILMQYIVGILIIIGISMLIGLLSKILTNSIEISDPIKDLELQLPQPITK